MSDPAPERYPFNATTLEEAKAWLRKWVEPEGAPCPCCTQLAKVYRRKLHAAMAANLIRMYRLGGVTRWVHVPTEIGTRSRDEAKLAYWGLMEESTEPRDDGGRAGWWRVTLLGARFVRREVKVLSHARVYDGRRLSLVGEPVTIDQCLGQRFDYDELMRGG